MKDEELIARGLQQRLGRDARVVGEGAHWDVVVGDTHRGCKIACFWYDDAAGLALGMNPSNVRAALQPPRAARSGAEYLVRFYEAGGGSRVVGRKTSMRSSGQRAGGSTGARSQQSSTRGHSSTGIGAGCASC
jgi:hypothetical protein